MTRFLASALLCTLFLSQNSVAQVSKSDYKNSDRAKLLLADSSPTIIHISIDGLRGDAVSILGPQNLPSLYRLINEGSSTLNARSDRDYTITLPNHTSQLTGRGVLGVQGHNWTSNGDPSASQTLHNNANFQETYCGSVFDVAHDWGLRTGLYASKSKFIIYEQSYNVSAGAEDQTGVDHGADKIDIYNFNDSIVTLTSSLISDMNDRRFDYAFIHLRDPDTIGHGNGWNVADPSPYLDAIRKIDIEVGRIIDMVENDPVLRDNTTIILTADHGGGDPYFSHTVASAAINYIIPFAVWGPDIPSAQNLYDLEGINRVDPGTTRPNYADPNQPIRNGDAANFSLRLLGLPSIPGSTIGATSAMEIGDSPYPRLEILNDQVTLLDSTVSIGLLAYNPNGASLTYDAIGLPIGLSINPATGEISGTAQEFGQYEVYIEVSDGTNSNAILVNWVVIVPPPVDICPIDITQANWTTDPNGILTIGYENTTPVDHWELVVNDEDDWKYILPQANLDPSWIDLGYDDSSWDEGPGGFGYGDGDDNTVLPSTRSVFQRKVFNISDLSKIENFMVHVDWDDAFVAYLNGVEIGRENIGSVGDRPDFDDNASASHEATIYAGGTPDFNFLTDKSQLIEGDNILAIQTHNRNLFSSDLSSRGFVTVGVNDPSMTYQALPNWFEEPSLPSGLMRIEQDGRTISEADLLFSDIEFEPEVGNTYTIENFVNGYSEFRHTLALFVVNNAGVRRLLFDFDSLPVGSPSVIPFTAEAGDVMFRFISGGDRNNSFVKASLSQMDVNGCQFDTEIPEYVSLEKPETQYSYIGENISLQLDANSPVDSTLYYSSPGLPAGLVLNELTGELSGSLSSSGTFDITISVTDSLSYVTKVFEWKVGAVVSARAFLQGPYNPATSSMLANIARADIPLKQPYKGVIEDYFGEETVQGSFGANVVDWVWIEIRKNTPLKNETVDAGAGLLMSNGDILGPNGEPGVIMYNMPTSDSYHIVIHHRNHLPVMTNVPIVISGSPPSTYHADFTDGANVHGSDQEAQFESGGVFALWNGDANGNGTIQYAGSNNDRVEILSDLNGPSPFDNLQGYLRGDINLDGVLSYAGSNNDRVLILSVLDGPTPFSSRSTLVPNALD